MVRCCYDLVGRSGTWARIARAASRVVRETLAGQAEHVLVPGASLPCELTEAGLGLAGIQTERRAVAEELSAAIAAAALEGLGDVAIVEAIQAGDVSAAWGDAHRQIERALDQS